MKKFPDLRYQSGTSVLELRLKARGAVHYYRDNWFVGRFETLEEAFNRIHNQSTGTFELACPPRNKSDWVTISEQSELIAA